MKALNLRIKATLIYLVFATMPLLGETVQVGDLEFDLNETEHTATIVRCLDRYLSGELNLPATIYSDGIEYTVTKIGESAFYRYSITSVSIPPTITTIGSFAFQDCSHLNSLELPNSVTTIEESAFNGCNAIKSIYIPSSVEYIGKFAFSIWPPEIERVDFDSIESLCKINFDGVASNPMRFSKNVYLGGEIINDIVIPSDVTAIGQYAFNGAPCLKSVTMTSSVQSIGSNAFNGCLELTSITIKDDSNSTNAPLTDAPTIIGKNAFEGCKKLNTIDILPHITEIEEYAFANCVSLTSISIPNSVKIIGPKAFDGCMWTNSIHLPNSLKEVGSYAFNDCRAITSLVIPNSVTFIGYKAFGFCRNLGTLTLGNSLTDISGKAFEGCQKLVSIYYNTDEPVEASKEAFDIWQYKNTTLYVREAAIEKCKEIEPWKNFGRIESIESSGVEDVIVDNDATLPCEVYTLDGIRVAYSTDGLPGGSYIVRQGNKVKKIIR